MGKNKYTKSPNASAKKQIKRKSDYNKLIIIVMAIISIVTLGYLALIKNNSGSSKSEVTNTTSSNIVPGIEIDKAELSDIAKFYPYESDGIKMEVLALKAEDGTERVAFNTCQVCYASGGGYYLQEGDELVCQNCGNRFTANMVGKIKGGCNPIPIPDENKADDGTNIIIDKNYLDKNKAYFSNWKI